MAADTSPQSPTDLRERISSIELLVLDVDGVLTDGLIVVSDTGAEAKHFHVRDGAGISFWRKLGKRVAILSGRSAPAVTHRARELGIKPVWQGVEDKGKGFDDLLAELGATAATAAYVGDDLPDIPAMLRAGFSACPGDAAAEVKAVANYTANLPGGRGVVREVIEHILTIQGSWSQVTARHHAVF